MKKPDLTKLSLSPENLKEHNNTVVIIIMLVSTLMVAASFIISRELLSDVKFNNRVYSAKREANNNLAENLKNLPKLEEEFKQLKQDGPTPEEILSALPVEQDYPGFASSLELISNLSGVSLGSVAIDQSALSSASLSSMTAAQPTATASSNNTTQTAQPNQSTGVQEVKFRLKVSGSYSSILRLIAQLEGSQRPVVIESVDIGGEDQNLQAAITLTTYFKEAKSLELQTKVVQ